MLKNFLDSIIKKDGFILETSDKKNYIIGKPIKKIPVKFKLKNKSIEVEVISSHYVDPEGKRVRS